MRGQAFIAVSALTAALLAAPNPASAQSFPSYHDEYVAQQQQCQRARNNNTVAGAAFGGLVGAFFGSQTAARRHRTDGSVLGAVVGAAAGASMARSNTRCAQVPQGSYDPYYGQSYQQYPSGYGQDPYYEPDNSGLEGGPYRDSGYYDDRGRQDCRTGQMITRDPYGREYRENVEMCLGADGVWRPRY